MDNFHAYLKKQLLDYVTTERAKGIPLEQIEKVLMDAGHHKNIIDEVFAELKTDQAIVKPEGKEPVEKDISTMLKTALSQFMSQAKTSKEVKEIKTEVKKTDTKEIIKEVIDEAEVIEEKIFFEAIAFFAFLVVLGGIILFSAGATDSPIAKVAIGFAPTIISVFICFFALKLADNAPIYIMIPLGISSAFYAAAKFSKLGIFSTLDPEGLSVINFLLSFVFCIMVIYIRYVKPGPLRRKVIKKNKSAVFSNTGTVEKKSEIEELKKEFHI